MKKEARLLLERAYDSLLLSIELFNRPNDRGRVNAVLIQLDHAFEMLLKSAILARGGAIREPKARNTIGFDACVRKGVSEGAIKFLSDEQAVTLQAINGLRDAAQHHLLDIMEAQLYVHAQSGVTLFRDLLKSIFKQELSDHLPERVLPVSTIAPTDIITLFDHEIEEIRKLLSPGKRMRVEAVTRLRSLAILDTTIKGEKGQPSNAELNKACRRLQVGEDWATVFQGVAAINIITDGEGPSIALRLSKKEGIETRLVAEGTPGASVVALKTTDSTGYYSLMATKLGEKLGLNRHQVLSVINYLGLKDDPHCYKEFKMGSQCHKHYSPKAIDAIRKALEVEPIEAIVEKMKQRKREQ
ncbi:DUF3644 domain-containing protein [Pseudodesulfovibrio pelocollis]|uniref:DUF3644 domain-containing protein n=1 Tax=Pseudodesulfovibrio pelocollis TaxID=3051432 RepID=UPI00255AFA27|nr:DUF3644 domain-containing protein [Pseudodesulfovibrio sp. SB368]